MLAKESSFASCLLLQLKCSCPEAKHTLVTMWVTKALAVGCPDSSVSSVIFCAHMNSIQLPFLDGRKGSIVISDQYFI